MEMEAKGKAKLMIKVRAYKGEIKGFKSKVVSLARGLVASDGGQRGGCRACWSTVG